MLAKLAFSVLIGGGSLAVGAAPALAAVPGSAAPSNHGAHCGKWAETVLAHLQDVDGRISTALPKLEAAEQKAQSAGHAKMAARIGHRITRLEDWQNKVNSRLAKIEQRCPGLSTTNGSATSAPTSNS